jgi:hypothetical protein
MFEASELTAKADSDGAAAGQMAGKHVKLVRKEEDKSWRPVRKAPLVDEWRKRRPCMAQDSVSVPSNETLTPRGSLHHRPKSANIPKKYQSF